MSERPIPYFIAGNRLRMSGLAVQVREATPTDLVFVEDLLCARSRPLGRATSNAEWAEFYRPKARRQIGSSRTVVAATEHDGTDVILGFVMIDASGAVVLLYVKLQYRGNGIGMHLVESAGLVPPIRVREARGWRRWAAVYDLPWEMAT